MSYLVLARKWRPRNFGEMVGQEHVLRALVNALDSGRVHHAFLFTGTRGVGKTTVARILAKSLNCERGVGAHPCGECGACREIDEGRFVDLIEVDAASRTKVDDTRELLENVQYAPTRGRYKVYLIDEVHMLSNHSFNALLKTLEEPPPHVKFLLATTDPQKVPVTVLSRCLQFSLKRLPKLLISERLRHILDAEGVAYEPAAVDLLSRAADGSLRDALSLLDQILVFGGGRVVETEARAMLGTIDRGFVVQLLDRLADHDARGVLEAIAAMDAMSPDYAQVLEEFAALLQKIALRQAVAGLPEDEVYETEALDGFAARMSAEDLQLYYQIAILGRRDLPLAPEPRGGVEMVLLRMLAFRPAAAPPVAPPSGGGSKPAAVKPAATKPAVPSPAKASGPAAVEASVTPAPAAPSPVPAAVNLADWPATLARLDITGAGRQLATQCSVVSVTGDTVHLCLDARSEGMRTRQLEERLAQSLTRYVGRPMRVAFEVAEEAGDTPARQQQRERDTRLEQARAAIESDPTVRALQDRFAAVIQPDSIRPLG